MHFRVKAHKSPNATISTRETRDIHQALASCALLQAQGPSKGNLYFHLDKHFDQKNTTTWNLPICQSSIFTSWEVFRFHITDDTSCQNLINPPNPGSQTSLISIFNINGPCYPTLHTLFPIILYCVSHPNHFFELPSEILLF